MLMALEGIVILDLSRLAPGPYSTMILGDLGAEVIRIESPDPRSTFEGMLGQNSEEAERFRAYNPQGRNKRSIVIDLRKEEGRKVFYSLAKGADVIVEEFRPGVVKELGIDYETIQKINPKIVYCSLTGYGQDGPYAKLPGHDINYIAVAGALSVVKDEAGRPVVPSNLLADMAGGGMHAALGILAALVARSIHGMGQHIDCAMTEGVLSLMHFETMWPLVMGNKMGLGGMNREFFGLPFIGLPFYDIYETQDGKWISFGNVEPWFWGNFCKAMGREDLITHQMDPDRTPEVSAFFQKVFKEKTQEEWFALLKDKNICVAPVLTLKEAQRNPHLAHRKMFVELDHPKFGKIKQTGISIKLSKTPGRVRSTGPLPGEHTDVILRKLGYTEGEIKKLRESRTVA